jgi:DNA-binding transcriptional LysR family regulator
MELSQRVRAIVSFVEAASAGSFAAAARSQGISPAAVSKNIAGLEQALGVRLMNRTTRTLSLTEEGTRLLQQARIAIGALDTAMDAVVARKMETRGHVRISTSAAFGREQLLPVLPGLRARYPGISVEVDFDDRVTDLIADGYDLTIRGGRIVDSSLISRPSASSKPRWLPRRVSCALRRTQNTRRPGASSSYRPAFLRGAFPRGGSGKRWQPDHAGARRCGCDPLRTGSPDAGGTARVGIAQVGVHHALAHLQAGALKTVLVGQHDPGNYEMVIQYPHRALVAPRVKATVEYLLDAFRQDASLHFPVERLADYAASPLPSPHQNRLWLLHKGLK